MTPLDTLKKLGDARGGPLLAALGRSWAALGALLATLGPLMAALEPLLAALGALLGHSWPLLEPF